MVSVSSPRVGVLALQGNFNSHATLLRKLGASVLEVRRKADLDAVSGIVLPGGESTAMLKLMDEDLRNGLVVAISSGMPTLATCAGVILLAKAVTNPEQSSFAVLDVDVERNSYGRQVESFVDKGVKLTGEGIAVLGGEDYLEGVFIRAPKIVRTGRGVAVLAKESGDPVLVREGQIFAATFHPELSQADQRVHQLFLSTVSAS